MHLEIDDRKADQRPGLGSLAQPLLDRRNIFLGDVAALDLVDELEARSALRRADADINFGELAGAPRLLLVGVGEVDRLPEIFAISYLRRADIGLDLDLA